MVLKTQLCRFSGAKLYPGKGIKFVRTRLSGISLCQLKMQAVLPQSSKPSKLTWTIMYRKQHKKDIHAEAAKKRRCTAKKPYFRSIVGATLEVIQKKRFRRRELKRLKFEMLLEKQLSAHFDCSTDRNCAVGRYCQFCGLGLMKSRCVPLPITDPFKLINNSSPFNKYAFLTTHNSYAINRRRVLTGSPRCTLTNQEDSITHQLNNGV
ncbi:hypothetical protein MRB53_011630 [Persea americana]|uniref:Uncharacterized protein n=1 Tax=Persea americana TaxID=3435 RepID=A0ACC2LVV8_PERAE|nr:hypothetical protein MRB53_011630 [Persea americana]